MMTAWQFTATIFALRPAPYLPIALLYTGPPLRLLGGWQLKVSSWVYIPDPFLLTGPSVSDSYPFFDDYLE